jgi:diguanylate cyclase (GGDEF)-like protein
LFDEQLGLLEKGRRWPVSVIVADVDGLKRVNDTLGHSMGDGLLVRAARILADGVRADDIVARIGGDEFAVLLPVADEQAVLWAVERLEESLLLQPDAETRPAVSLSLGHATAKVGDIAAALKLADMRMYVRKAERKASLTSCSLAPGAQLIMSWDSSPEHEPAPTPAAELAGTL